MRGDARDLAILRALEDAGTAPAIAARTGQGVAAVLYRLRQMRKVRWCVLTRDGNGSFVWRSRIDPKQLELLERVEHGGSA